MPSRIQAASKTQRDDVDSFVCAVCNWVQAEKVLKSFYFQDRQDIWHDARGRRPSGFL